MKKDLNYYLSLNYPMEVISDHQGGYTIVFRDLPGCITCCDKPEDIIPMAEDAKKAWLEASLEDGININEPNNIDDYSGQFKLRIPKSLHKNLADNANKEGVSMNQYCMYLLSEGLGLKQLHNKPIKN